MGTEAAHKTEFVTERTVSSARPAWASLCQRHTYRKVEKLERKSTKATVEARYREAIRDTPELQEHTFKAQLQKRRLKRKYAKELRKAQQAVGGATVWGTREERRDPVRRRLPVILSCSTKKAHCAWRASLR